MKKDIKIQLDILEEFRCKPLLTETKIEVSVKNGIATLSGTYDNYSEKITAERVVKSISGVRAVVGSI